MEEESGSSYDFQPINTGCPTNQKNIISDNGSGTKNNNSIDATSNQSKSDAMYDQTNQVTSLYGGNINGLKNYEIIYKKKKINIKTFNINEALIHLINRLDIKKDCLFQTTEINKKKTSSIYHFKNNKRKSIIKIR